MDFFHQLIHNKIKNGKKHRVVYNDFVGEYMDT